MKQLLLSTLLLIPLLMNSGCGFEERKRALDAREAALQEREQDLLLKQKQLTQLEDSMKLNLARQDSATSVLKNLGLPLPDSLQGVWNISMICTQTSCTGFAVGDSRKENWTFSGGDSTGVYIKAMQGEKLIRIYSGIYDGGGFILSTLSGSDSITTVMNVKLSVENGNKLSGTRVINQADGCSATFRLDAERSKR